MLKRLAPFFAAFLFAAQAMAQTLPSIPPVPDVNRTVTYNVTSSTSVFSFPFALYGDCTDIQVTVAGATESSSDYTCSSVAYGALTNAPLPITDLQVTLTTPVTSGSVTIAGAYHPRNVVIPTAPGISRREFEQTVNTMVSGMRELYADFNAIPLLGITPGSTPVNDGTPGGILLNSGGTIGNSAALGANVLTGLTNTLNASGGLVGYSGALGTPSSGNGSNITNVIAANVLNINQIATAGAASFVSGSTPGATAFFLGQSAPWLPDANINFVNDRLMVGAAAVNSQIWNATTGSTIKDYVDTFESTRSNAAGWRTSWAQTASLSTVGGIGLLGGAQSLNSSIPDFQLNIGVNGYGINNNTTTQQSVWGGYFYGARVAGAGVSSSGVDGTSGVEIDIVDEGTAPQLAPANVFKNGFTAALQLNSGGHDSAASVASTAISIGNNLGTFDSGIVIAQNALNGTTGSSGAASAIRMGNYHQVEWWMNASSTPYFTIGAYGGTPANAQAIRATDTGITIGAAATPGLNVTYPGVSTAFAQIVPAYSTQPVVMQAIADSGSGGNAGLSLRSSGTGSLLLGSAAGDTFGLNPSGMFIATTDNTYDIGAAGGTRPRTGYFATAVNVNGAVYDNTAWTPYTPTASCSSGTLTTATPAGRYKVRGKTTFIDVSLQITTVGSCTGSVKLTLPNTSNNAAMLAAAEEAVTGMALNAVLGAGGTQVSFSEYNANSAAVSGYLLIANGSYENQ